MAKFYFKYGSMSSGKSTLLLQAAHNYRERNMVVDIFKSVIDTRDGASNVVSRIGLSAPSYAVDKDFSFSDYYAEGDLPDCVLVDEVQFLSTGQVYELRELVDSYDVPVICYGLRTDFKRHLFPASGVLLGIADTLEEIKTVCHCGKSAKFVLRLDASGAVVKEGGQIHVGGNESYVSVCSKHWLESKVRGE